MFFYFLSNFQQLFIQVWMQNNSHTQSSELLINPAEVHATCHHTQTSPVWTAQVELCPKSYASCNGFMLLFWKFSRYTQLAFPLPLPCFHSADSPESLSAHGLIVMAQRRAGGRFPNMEEGGSWLSFPVKSLVSEIAEACSAHGLS